MDFFGREDVMASLNALWNKRVSSLVTCRGRRRIGKSTLIERFAEKSHARLIKIEGVKPSESKTNLDELSAFARQLSDQCGTERTPPEDWSQAFMRLDSQLTKGGRTIVLLDEVSWLGYYDDSFADYLKIAWDNRFKKHDKLVFVVCGSVSTWIRDCIVDNSAFMGRRSLDIVMRELPLKECVKFWGKAATRVDPKEIFDVLSVTGGVPRYLEEIDPLASAADNIRRLAFAPDGVLRLDFDDMFMDVITKRPEFTEKVMRTLVPGPRSAAEIAEKMGIEKSGNITLALKQLCESGFVSADVGRNPETGGNMKEVKYRLSDNYSRFYLKFIEPVKDVIDHGSYAFVSMEQYVDWEGVMGLAFENLIVNNYRELLPHLKLDRSLIESAAPYRRAGTKSGRSGVQVDLLIQTRLSACLVEIKRRRHLGREVIQEMVDRCGKFVRRDGMSLKTALVYEGDLAMSVEADGYFDAVVPARILLGL